MDISGDLIWGDDGESEVCAQVQNKYVSAIFRYSLNGKHPQSLPSPIVTCYHDLPANDAKETFSDRPSMREALYSSVRRVWDQCAVHPSIAAPDVTVEIYEDARRQIHWRISHESIHKQYVESLLPVSNLFQSKEAELQLYDTVSYSSLIPIIHLGGRGGTAAVRRSSSSDSLYVFKGVNFGTFLESPADFEHRKKVFYHEIQTISSLPRHPNILPPATTFLTVGNVGDDQHASVCGTLYPFMQYGTLDDKVETTKATGARLGLSNKASWCFQMTSAIAHTHFAGHTFHMDIKPANFVIDSNQDLVLIDWEQSGAPLYTLAPEANGAWDVKEEKVDSSGPKPIYERYTGPHRENLAWGQPKWNVFPIWKDLCPRALEAAEVFSLGRTMWMLLQQVTQSEVEDLGEIAVYWNDDAKDIPDDWKSVVGRCLDPDPNKRIGLLELLDFWKDTKCEDRVHSTCALISNF